ncbi:chemotaxis protein CheW [Aquabacter sp. CN5-332]|uniref:chemotaxis protein CheW n=1 Tax=Aquabacter sp. CN5-332 TaxID=3156608 RepID=UPI0032B431DB
MAESTDPDPGGLDWGRALARLEEIAARLDGSASAEDFAAEMARRASILAAPERAATSVAPRQMVLFGYGAEQYALDIDRAAAVVPLTEVVPLPGVDAIHLGLVVHRGALYALIDLNALLERPVAHDAAPAFAVLIEDPDCAIGLAADTLVGIRRVDEARIEATTTSSALVTAILDGGASLLSPDALTRNARLIVDHRLRDTHAP